MIEPKNMTIDEKERFEICNFTLSGKHLWGLVKYLNNNYYSEDKHDFVDQYSTAPKCAACGMVNDIQFR